MRYTPMNMFDVMVDQFLPKEMEPTHAIMTDIKELENAYLLEMNLPGFSKEDIHISLLNGNLKVEAHEESEKEEKDDEGTIIHKERHSGTFMRSFHVGKHVKEEDVKASFKDGVLKVEFPKENKEEIENSKYIEIE